MAITRIFRVARCRFSSELSTKIIGIDSGTINSRVAILKGNVPNVIPSWEAVYDLKSSLGKFELTPSVVTLTQNGTWLVGRDPYSQTGINLMNTLFQFKHLMGRKFDDDYVVRVRESMGFKIVGSPWGDVTIEVRKRRYSPTEIQGLMFRRMKEIAASSSFFANHNLKAIKAVITVPACFNDIQSRAIKEAGELGGLEVMGLIDEPIAAALSYGMENMEGLVAVLDLGGTLKFSVLEISKGEFKVKAKTANLFLGGHKFDIELLKWLLKEIKHVDGVDLSNDMVALQRCFAAVDNAKMELSTKSVTEISLEGLDRRMVGKSYNVNDRMVTLTRSIFESLIDGMIEEIRTDCIACLEASKISIKDIDEVLLIGGLSNVPKVQDLVNGIFERSILIREDNSEAVVRGAAIAAGSLDENWIEK